MKTRDYEHEMRRLHGELVAMQEWVRSTGAKVCIVFEGRDITFLKESQLRDIRRDVQMIFQDPYSSLNPRHTIGSILTTPLKVHGLHKGKEKQRVKELLELVGLNPEHINRYPSEFSGGQRQRIGIARALAVEPEILLMDEPLGALDAQTRLILQVELLRIWSSTGTGHQHKTAIFITHDIEEAVFLADRVVVMSRHPGRVRAVLPIDLPRPRDDAIRADPRFGQLAEEIWGLIRDEARQAIA